MQSFLVAIFVLCTLYHLSNGCSTECCQSGGTCGDAVFDDCQGSWDYRKSCSPSYHVCCLPARPMTTTTSVQTTPSSTPAAVETTAAAVEPTGGDVSAGPTVSPPVSNCGMRTPAPYSFHPLIVGGEAAAEHSWPWQASLQEDFGWAGYMHFCGGTLITDRFVITAAHCMGNWAEPSMFRVVLGEHDRSSNSGQEVIVSISRIIVHEDWSADVSGSPNDLALLELSTPVQFNDFVQPACLPEYQHQQFYPSDDCWISGWGDTKSTGDNNVLQEVKLNITEYDDCRNKWLTGTGGKDYVKTSHVCVGNGVPGACNGDSGGPLVCARNNKFTLVGATSFGAAGCLELDAPNVYTKISHFLPWILEKIGS